MEDRRLRPKYYVQRVPHADEHGKPSSNMMVSTDPDDVDSPFVLMPRKDPAAFEAMRVYALFCEPQLANEIRTWLRKIAQASPLYGTQGKRNRTAVRLKLLAEAD